MTICPHCEKQMTQAKIEGMKGKVFPGSKSWNCIAYSCPWCNKAISIQIDPVALDADLVALLQKRR